MGGRVRFTRFALNRKLNNVREKSHFRFIAARFTTIWIIEAIRRN